MHSALSDSELGGAFRGESSCGLALNFWSHLLMNYHLLSDGEPPMRQRIPEKNPETQLP